MSAAANATVFLTPSIWPAARLRLDGLQAVLLRVMLGLRARGSHGGRLSTFRGLWLASGRPQRLGTRVIEEGIMEMARAELAPADDLGRPLAASWVPDESVFGGIRAVRGQVGVPPVRDTPPPQSDKPKTWMRSYREKWVRPGVHRKLENPWWQDHAMKPKHAAFLARAGPPGGWLDLLIETATEGARWGDAEHAARLLVADVVRVAGDDHPWTEVWETPGEATTTGTPTSQPTDGPKSRRHTVGLRQALAEALDQAAVPPPPESPADIGRWALRARSGRVARHGP